MSSLLPQNATRLQRDIESATNWLTQLPAEEIKKIASPWTCPVELLPWLAWAWSVDDWDSAWSEAVRRRVVADSPAWHRIKGTPHAIAKLLAAQTIEALVREWWEYSDGAPHSFRVEIQGETRLTEELPAQVLRAVRSGKNARSYMDRLRVDREMDYAPVFAHGLIYGYSYHLGPAQDTDFAPQAVTLAHGLMQGVVIDFYPGGIGYAGAPNHLYAGGQLSTARITEIHPYG